MPERLSVIIPAFNAQTSIQQAVRSAWQADADEVIVVDDGSTDSTASLAEAACATVIKQPNAGASLARERGFARASGELCVFLDADDQLIDSGVAVSVERIKANPHIAVAAGMHVEARQPSRRLRRPLSAVTVKNLIDWGYCPWPPGAAVFRSSKWREAMEHPAPRLRLRYADNYEELLRLTLVGDAVSHDVPCLRYELAGGKSARGALAAKRDSERIRASYAAFAGISFEPLDDARIRSSAYRRIARSEWADSRRMRAGGRIAMAAWWRARSEVHGRLGRFFCRVPGIRKVSQ